MSDWDICEVRRCRKPSYIIYMGKDVCSAHWEKHCDDNNKFDLKKEFNLYKKGKEGN